MYYFPFAKVAVLGKGKIKLICSCWCRFYILGRMTIHKIASRKFMGAVATLIHTMVAGESLRSTSSEIIA